MRVLIIEDHELLSQSLAVALTGAGFDAVVAAPADGDVLDAAADADADITLLDLDLGPGIDSGLALIEPLRNLDSLVLVVTGVTDRAVWGRAVEAGAAGVVSKSEPFDTLVDAVARLSTTGWLQTNAERQELLADLRRRRREQDERLAPFEQLTKREAAVLAGLMAGESAESIAEQSFVALATVRSQIQSVFRKLGVNSQLAAVARAREAGWQPPS